MNTNKVTVFPQRNQVQDVIADGTCQQPHDDALTQAQREIFIFIYGEAAWSEGGFQDERRYCLRLAATLQDILRERWTLFNAAERLTVHSVELVCGTQPVTEETRQLLQDYAESYVEDLPVIFGGDGRIRPEFRRKGQVS